MKIKNKKIIESGTFSMVGRDANRFFYFTWPYLALRPSRFWALISKFVFLILFFFLILPTSASVVVVPCKRTQQVAALLGPTMLALVAYSLKPVKFLAQQVPTFLLFCDRRSAVCMETQQCWPRENVCARAS